MSEFRCGFITTFSLRDRLKLLFGARLRGKVWQLGQALDEWRVDIHVGEPTADIVGSDALCCAEARKEQL